MLKIKHQATCLDLSQKSSSSNTPTSDYYLKHYHQPKCNQPGHKFVDEDQEKTSEQSTKLKLFGHYTSENSINPNSWTSSNFGSPLWWQYLWTWQKQSESLDCYVESCTTLYSTIYSYSEYSYSEYSYTDRYTGALYLSSPNQPACLLWYWSHPPTRSIKRDNNNSCLPDTHQTPWITV